MTSKKDIRLYAKKIKTDIDLPSVSSLITDKLLALPELKTPGCVMLYRALGDEVNVDGLLYRLHNTGIDFCFPVVCGDVIEARSISDDGFKTGAFGISEPTGAFVDPGAIDVVIVPGVAFDVECMRLGRGKGYYDRFLSSTNALKIGVCPDCLCLDKLPCEQHDLRVDVVITEKRTVWYGR